MRPSCESREFQTLTNWPISGKAIDGNHMRSGVMWPNANDEYDGEGDSSCQSLSRETEYALIMIDLDNTDLSTCGVENPSID